MAIDIDLSAAPRAIRIRVSDVWPTTDEQATIQSQLLSDGHLLPETRVLVDIRDVKPPGYQQAIKVVETGVAGRAWPRWCAFLVSSAVQYGFSRQLEALAPVGGTVEIFNDESAARAWLDAAAHLS